MCQEAAQKTVPVDELEEKALVSLAKVRTATLLYVNIKMAKPVFRHIGLSDNT